MGIGREDLEAVFKSNEPFWSELKNQRIFLTGGTGFIGKWILETFLYANRKLDLNASILVLTRNAEAFNKSYPHLCQENVEFQTDDILHFPYTKGRFSHVIHLAGDSNACQETDETVFSVLSKGTKRTLEFAETRDCEKFLFLSSGAFYGTQPLYVKKMHEAFSYQITDSCEAGFSYRMGKRVAEKHVMQSSLKVKIARLYCAIGPYQNLNAHFAASQFIKDGLEKKPITITGHPETVRSYLYASDMASWLWRILFKGGSKHPYNVGSDEAFTIPHIAKEISKHFESDCVLDPPKGRSIPTRYVPSIERAFGLGLDVSIPFKRAVAKTCHWFKNNYGDEGTSLPNQSS
jgi:dTDP-glucose 4,6-dehydratase